MAVLLAVVIFATGTVLVRVEGSEQVRGRREAARMTVLVPGSEASRRWLSWARQEAPGMDRWELEFDGVLESRMKGLETALLRETRHQALLYPPEVIPRQSPLPPIINLERPALPPVPRDMVESRKGGMIEGQITVEIDEVLRERWSGSFAHSVSGLLTREDQKVKELRLRDFLGMDRRFLISVNQLGEIETCQVLNPEEHELDGLLSRWLRRQALKPGEEGLLWGKIRVKVRGFPAEVSGIEED